MERKGSTIVGVSPDSTVVNALEIMAEKNIGSVIVLENGKYLGIMTERDYSRKVILKGTVRSWAEREEAERVAWSAPGVTRVEDRIVVAP